MQQIKLASGSLPTVLVLLCVFLLFRPACDLRKETSATPSRNVSGSDQWGIYDPSSKHIWNRLYRSLFSRVTRYGKEFGADELDPLLWDSTKHLLGGSPNREALNCLNEFLDTNAERLISDPLKRTMLQRDLWAVFDWTVRRTTNSPSQEVAELQLKLSRVMRRLALTSEQIRTLPRTYDAAVAAKTFAPNHDPGHLGTTFLPPDLFQSDGPWVPLSVDDGSAIAPGHIFSVSGRSVFQVFIRQPQGRESTSAYLKRLSEFPKPWLRNRDRPTDVLPNPQLPEFPVGTQLALVRRMVVIDQQGKLIPTSVVESVQIRIHRTIPQEIPESFNTDSTVAREAMDVYEFKLSRARLFAGESGGLRAVTPEEKEFPLFQSHGIDLFEEIMREPIERNLRPILSSCQSCHFRPGIHSVLSRLPSIVLLRVRDVRRNLMISPDSEYEDRSTVGWKQSQDSWKRLREMWQLQSAAPAD